MTKYLSRTRFLLPAGYFAVWLLALLFFWGFTGATDPVWHTACWFYG